MADRNTIGKTAAKKYRWQVNRPAPRNHLPGTVRPYAMNLGTYFANAGLMGDAA